MGLLSKLFGKADNSKELLEKIKNGALLVDVRTPAEFGQAHVKGSVNIPLNQILSQKSKFNLTDCIIVFCQSGNRSSQAKALLEANGFGNIINGGSWQNINLLLNK
jgi:phage shock protein E